MDLELATISDIVRELHDRRVKFVLVGVENSNLKNGNFSFISANARKPEELLRMIEFGRTEIKKLNDAENTDEDDFYEE